jgi:hypothetical protein
MANIFSRPFTERCYFLSHRTSTHDTILVLLMTGSKETGLPPMVYCSHENDLISVHNGGDGGVGEATCMCKGGAPFFRKLK